MHRFSLLALALLPAVALSLPPADKDAPKLLKPINLAVNTKADEDDPHLSSNGLRLYYSCNARGKFDILVSERGSTTQAWRPGKITDDCEHLRTKVDDRSVFVTPEGRYPQYIFFATKKDDEKKGSFDIYVAIKVLPGRDRVFSEVRDVVNINSPADELHPWLTADGRSFYFSRKTKEGWRVFVATRPNNMGPQGFEEPVPLKEFPADFHHATLTPDGKTMYLQGPLEKGRWGLFVSYKTPKGWSEPEPLDMLNHPDGPTGDKSPGLSRDGSLLYFASDRPDGKGGLDLWVVPTKELVKKK